MTEKSTLPAQTAPPPSSPPPDPVEVFRCSVRNPSQRAHVVYGGMLSDVQYYIKPGETIEANLSDALIDVLVGQESVDPEEPGLHVVELGTYEPPPPPEARQRRPRPGRITPQP